MGTLDKRRWLLTMAALALAHKAHSARPMPVGFFGSLNAEHPFWATVRQFEESVGRGLGISSRWNFANSDPRLGHAQIVYEATAAVPIQGAVITDFKAQGKRYLDLVQELKIPAITLAGAEFNKLGQPRKHNPFWIGAITTDEEAAGYQLSRHLLDEALRLRLTGRDGKVHVVGVSGDVNSPLARDREAGLARAVAEYAGAVVVQQVIPTTDWSTQSGAEKVRGLLQRYADATVVWSANDAMALGAVQAIAEQGKEAGKDIVTGGIDWTPQALDLVRLGAMVCSVGGLGFQAGWAAVLMHDYLRGHDFADDVGAMVNIPIATLTRSNVSTYLKAYGDGRWRTVDFSRFSKVHNPARKKYDFSIGTLLTVSAPRALGNHPRR